MSEGFLADLEPAELAMLGHALRMVPGNAVLTGDSLQHVANGKGLAYFHDIPAYKTLWGKVSAAIAQRDDMEEFRVRTIA